MNNTTNTAGKIKTAGASRSLREMRARAAGMLAEEVIVAIRELRIAN